MRRCSGLAQQCWEVGLPERLDERLCKRPLANDRHSTDLCWRTFHILSNGLHTTRRAQESIQPCFFCNRQAGDELEHYARCCRLHTLTRRTLPVLRHTPLDEYTFFLAEEVQPATSASIVILHDLFTWTLRELRHHGSRASPEELFEARAHQLLQRRPALTPLLRPH